MLLGALGANFAKVARQGQGVIRASEGTIRAGQDF